MDNIFFDLKKLKYIGKGAIIGKTVRIRRPENTIIGDYSIIDDFTYISCDLEIGKYCHISANVNFIGGRGKVRIGDFVGIGAGSSIYAASSDYISASMELPSIPEEFRFGGIIENVIIDNYVLLGAHTTVMPGAHLPEGFASTAQTVVRKYQYNSWTLYGGFECKKLIKRSHDGFFDRIEKINME